jgi:hypothetical protein
MTNGGSSANRFRALRALFEGSGDRLAAQLKTDEDADSDADADAKKE